MMLANHHNLFLIFKASIATTYGFSRMPEKYLQKYDAGTLTIACLDHFFTWGI